MPHRAQSFVRLLFAAIGLACFSCDGADADVRGVDVRDEGAATISDDADADDVGVSDVDGNAGAAEPDTDSGDSDAEDATDAEDEDAGDADGADAGDADGTVSDADEDSDAADDVEEGPSMERRVLAFYYPWYRTPAFSGRWWHWNEEGHNPTEFVAPGRRDIAARYYPAIDVYDSLDPDVIDLHIQQSVEAGIDAWIISWWGDDTEMTAIMDRIEALDSPLKVAAYYERIPGCSSDLCSERTDEQKIASASRDIVNLLESLSDNPAWLTVDGEPVLFIYTRAIAHGLTHWASIIEEVERAHPVFISGGAFVTSTWEFVSPAFDQLHIYNPAGQITFLGEDSVDYEMLCNGARSRGQSCAATVIPGYDDSALPSRTPMIIPREDGALYEWLWARSVVADPDWILITSFNEWHEATEIEPSVEFGRFYLDATAALSASFKTPDE